MKLPGCRQPHEFPDKYSNKLKSVLRTYVHGKQEVYRVFRFIELYLSIAMVHNRRIPDFFNTGADSIRSIYTL
jgi:hypothetical protein